MSIRPSTRYLADFVSRSRQSEIIRVAYCPECPTLAHTYRVRGKRRDVLALDDLAIAAEAVIGGKRIIQYESGTIAIEVSGERVTLVLPLLRLVAAEVGVPLLGSKPNQHFEW